MTKSKLGKPIEKHQNLNVLVSRARNYKMSPAELKAQQESWVRGEMAIGLDKDEINYRKNMQTKGTQSMTELDPTKPVQTKGGLPARIICHNRMGEYPIVALVLTDDGKKEFLCTYKKDGTAFNTFFSSGLVNIPEKHTMWLNIYSVDCFTSFSSKEDADNVVSPNIVARLEVSWTEGEGLE